MTSTNIVIKGSGPSMLVRAVWFLFVGWWLVGVAVSIAWLALVTIIGLPLFAFLINRVPSMLTLKGRTTTWRSSVDANGVITMSEVHPEQRPWWQRGIYLILIGWWFSAIWMAIAWVLCLTILGIPFGVWMFNKTPLIATLLRY